MTEDTQAREVAYRVVINHEEQYSIWPDDRDLPDGWRDTGKTGTKEECTAHIDEVWTDMRPLSLRKYMEEMAQGQPGPEEEVVELDDDVEPLVSRLSRGTHPVEISLRPARTGAALKEAIDQGYVFVKFTETLGGTELGVQLDPDASDVTAADFEASAGRVRLVGDLTLDFEPVRCSAEIELTNMAGHGQLTLREPAS